MTTPDDLSDLVRDIQEEQEREFGVGSAAAAARDAHVPPAAEKRATRRKRLITGGIAGLGALLLGGGAAWAAVTAFSDEDTATEVQKPRPTAAPTPAPEPVTEESAPEPEPEPTPVPDPAPQWSIDDPNSMQVVVNKQRPVNPVDWTPGDLVMPNVPNQNGQPLRAEAAAALDAMYAEASAAGVPFTLASGFRDYGLQAALFDSYSASDGVEAAETYSARPGHSEHQTGLAADITECMGCGLSYEFADTAVGIWARDNAHRFGFILRYNDGQQPIVGYVYEPWHFRYVGPQVAADMRTQGIVNLEDYFGLPAAPAY